METRRSEPEGLLSTRVAAVDDAPLTPPASTTGRRKAGPVREWLIVPLSGLSYQEEVGKHSIMRRTGLPSRDLRTLDTMLSYPSTILGRERAVVIKLEHIRVIVTATEVLIPNFRDPLVATFVQDLKSKVSISINAQQASELEKEAYPTLDELTSQISTLNLERVRQIKNHLVALSVRVQKVRDEIEHLLDDDMDMAEMYLTEKLLHQSERGSSKLENSVEPDEESDELESDAESGKENAGAFDPDIHELEMLLEAYFVQIDGTSHKLSTVYLRSTYTSHCTILHMSSSRKQWELL